MWYLRLSASVCVLCKWSLARRLFSTVQWPPHSVVNSQSSQFLSVCVSVSIPPPSLIKRCVGWKMGHQKMIRNFVASSCIDAYDYVSRISFLQSHDCTWTCVCSCIGAYVAFQFRVLNLSEHGRSMHKQVRIQLYHFGNKVCIRTPGVRDCWSVSWKGHSTTGFFDRYLDGVHGGVHLSVRRWVQDE